MKKDFLDAGFYFDALEISAWTTNKNIVDKILDMKGKYKNNPEIQESLLKAQKYLTVERGKYEGEILPCLDYIRLLLKKRYGNEAVDIAIKCKLLSIEKIEQKIRYSPLSEILPEELKILLPENLLNELKEGLKPNLREVSEELFKKIVDSLTTSEELRRLEPEINNFKRDVLNFLSNDFFKQDAVYELKKWINEIPPLAAVNGLLPLLQKIREDIEFVRGYNPYQYFASQKVKSLLDTRKKLNEKIEKLNLQAEAFECMKLANGITIAEQKVSIGCISLYNWERKAEDYIAKTKSIISVPLIENDSIISVQILVSELEGLKKKLNREINRTEKQLLYHYKKITDDYDYLHTVRSKNKEIIEEIDKLVHKISQLKIEHSQFKIEENKNESRFIRGAAIYEQTDEALSSIYSKNKTDIEKIDRLINELSRLKIMEVEIGKNIKKLTEEDLSKTCSKNEANIKEIDKLLQELSRFKDTSFLSDLLGIISGRNKRVSMLKEKSLNLIREISLTRFDIFETKCVKLYGKEVVSVIDKELKENREKLYNINKSINKFQELKKEVPIIKEKSLNLLKDFSPDDFQNLNAKCSNLPEIEAVSVIDEELKEIRGKLISINKSINKFQDLKKKVSIIKEKSLNLLKDFSPDDFQSLNAKCSSLSEIEVISILDEELRIIQNKLKTEFDRISKLEDLQAKEKNVINLIAEGEKLKNESYIYKKLNNHEKDAIWITLNQRAKRKLITGGLNGEIFVWDFSPMNTKPMMRLKGHKTAVTGLIVPAMQNFLVSSGHDGQIILWNLEDGKIIKCVKASDKGVLALSLTHDSRNLISGGENGEILVWKFPQMEVETKLEGHSGAVSCLSLNKNGEMLFSGETNPIPNMSSIFFWDLKKRKVIKKIRWHGGGVTWLAISPDNKILASGENSPLSKIILWDLENCRMRDVLEGHQGSAEALIFTKNGKMLISRDGIGNIDDSKYSDIFLWDIDTGKPIVKIQGHKGSSKCTIDSAIDNDEKFLIGGGSNGLLIWDFLRIKENLKSDFERLTLTVSPVG